MWLVRAQQHRQRRLAELEVRNAVALVGRPLFSLFCCLLALQRIKSAALTRWTNRIVDVKLCELEISQQYEMSLLACVPPLQFIRSLCSILSFTFGKWKALCNRHLEDLRLMESYQEVKREGTYCKKSCWLPI